MYMENLSSHGCIQLQSNTTWLFLVFSFSLLLPSSLVRNIAPIGFDTLTPLINPSVMPSSKSWLIGKDSDAGRDWGQEEKGTTEDEMAGWHHWLDGREFEWTPGVGDGLGGLACCDSWGRRELAMTEQLNGTELNYKPKLHLTTRSSNCTTMCLPNWVENYVHSKPAHVFFIAALLKIVTNWKQQVNG